MARENINGYEWHFVKDRFLAGCWATARRRSFDEVEDYRFGNVGLYQEEGWS